MPRCTVHTSVWSELINQLEENHFSRCTCTIAAIAVGLERAGVLQHEPSFRKFTWTGNRARYWQACLEKQTARLYLS